MTPAIAVRDLSSFPLAVKKGFAHDVAGKLQVLVVPTPREGLKPFAQQFGKCDQSSVANIVTLLFTAPADSRRIDPVRSRT